MRLALIKRLRGYESAYDAVTVGVVCGFVLWQLHPSLIFSRTLLTGGDYGGHVQVPHYWRTYLLPHLQITGWSPDWYDGWPFLTFYFPLPSILVGLLSFVLPYSVAFKLVIAASLALLPACVYYFVRKTREPFPYAALAAVATGAYLFNTSYTIYGGNIFSTMAGEYSLEVGLCVAFLYLGAVSEVLASGRFRALCSVLLAAVILSHVLALALAGVGTLALLVGLGRADVLKRQVRSLAAVVLCAFLLASFWLVPFAAWHQYMSDMGYRKVTNYFGAIFASGGYPNVALVLAAAGLTIGALARGQWWLVTGLLAGVGAAVLFFASGAWWAVLMAVFLLVLSHARRPYALFVLVTGLLGLLAFRYLPSGGLVLNGRAEPFFVLAFHLAAALGVGEAASVVLVGLGRLSRSWPPLLSAASAVTRYLPAVGSLFVIWISVLDPAKPTLGSLASFVPHNPATSWAAFNFKGYEGQPGYPAFRGIMTLMERLSKKYGCGSAMWEYTPSYSSMGTTMALMLLPYFTKECVTSQEGLFFESSATTPYHFIDQAELSASPDYAMLNLPYPLTGPNLFRGIEHLKILGVRYFIAQSSVIQRAASFYQDLVPIGQVSAASFHFVVYLVRGSHQLEALKKEPVVITRYLRSRAPNLDPYTTTALAWWTNGADLGTTILADGPSYLPRVSSLGEAVSAQARLGMYPPVRITNVKAGTQGVSFDVSRTGVPVRVAVSYFPRWHATGALGPFRAFPNLMVVIPTRHHVELGYGPTPIDWLAKAGSLAGVILLAALVRIKGSWPGWSQGAADYLARLKRLGRAPVGLG